MTILKNNHHHYIHYQIFTLLISNHGVVNCLLLFLLALLPSATAQSRETEPPPPPPDPFGSLEPNFDPSMAIIMVVLVSVFFFMGFCSVYIRRCAQRRSRRSNTTIDPYSTFMAANNRSSRRAERGLEASVIETFPTFLYSAVKGFKIGKLSLECAVCLNEFEDDETLRLIPKCSHVFHPDCIDAWLASHTTCPVCRADLVSEPGETTTSPVNVQLFNPDSNSGEAEHSIEEISHADVERRDLEAADVNLINQNIPRRSRSSGWRLGRRLFPRSNSTGHSLVQAGENCERFTLRLPEEVRSELLMKTSSTTGLSRSKSCVAFPRVRSSRSGFRTGSGGLGLGKLPMNPYYYERFNSSSKSDRFGFTIAPPFTFRTGSVRSSKEMLVGATDTASHEVNSSSTSTPPKTNAFKSVKSKSNPLLIGHDSHAEHSFDRPDAQV